MAGVKDIASKAGVSMITVSRVINTPEKVSPETRERILKIMKEVVILSTCNRTEIYFNASLRPVVMIPTAQFNYSLKDRT